MCASPQKEDGYTPIAHEILEQLAKHVISSDEWRILVIIFRKTYGWNKKDDWISLGQFAEMTGILRQHIPRIIDRLLKRNIIIKRVTQSGSTVTRSGNTLGIKYGLQKDFENWRVLPKQVAATGAGNRGVTQPGKRVLPEQVPTIDNIQKKLTKEKTHSIDFILFYEAYPKKIGRVEAWKKWKILKKSNDFPKIETILKAIELQKETDQWKKDGGQFIPHPATWLNQGRWEDEVKAESWIEKNRRIE